MIVYRNYIVPTGGVTFHTTKDEAIRAYKGFTAQGLQTILEVLEVGSGKAEVVSALNLATQHPDHWVGEALKK